MILKDSESSSKAVYKASDAFSATIEIETQKQVARDIFITKLINAKRLRYGANSDFMNCIPIDRKMAEQTEGVT